MTAEHPATLTFTDNSGQPVLFPFYLPSSPDVDRIACVCLQVHGPYQSLDGRTWYLWQLQGKGIVDPAEGCAPSESEAWLAASLATEARHLTALAATATNHAGRC